MTECPGQSELFGSVGRSRIEAAFDGGEISSDVGGALLLRQAERRLGVLAAAAKCLPDDRDPRKARHSRLSQLKQRVFAIAMGYEDLNDHDTLRKDRGPRVGLNQRQTGSSAPTLCRFENVMGRAEAVALHGVLIENFIASHDAPPTELTLDLDATDDAVHGRQEGRFFHGYYDQYCFLPLYVFCGDELLTAYLRPANIDGAKHAAAIVKLLVQRLRAAWPQVKITIRADFWPCSQCDREWHSATAPTVATTSTSSPCPALSGHPRRRSSAMDRGGTIRSASQSDNGLTPRLRSFWD